MIMVGWVERMNGYRHTKPKPTPKPFFPGVLYTYLSFSRLPLCKNNESCTIHIEIRIHRASALLPPRQRQAHVHSISHAIHSESTEDGLYNFLFAVDILETKCLSTVQQSFQMFVERENSTFVDTDSYRIIKIHESA